MSAIQVGKMVVEEEEIAMSDRDQESETEGEKGLGRDLEKEVIGKEVGGQGREKENVAGQGQKKKGKVEGTPDHVHEIDGIEEIGSRKGRVEESDINIKEEPVWKDEVNVKEEPMDENIGYGGYEEGYGDYEDPSMRKIKEERGYDERKPQIVDNGYYDNGNYD